MTTVNPIVNPQVSTAFKGKSKKAFDALEKLANKMPEDALKQEALKDIRKPVSDEAFASAHKKARDVLEAFKNGDFKDIKVIDDSVFKSYNELSSEDKNILRKAYINDVLGYFFKPKKLTPEQAALERVNGMAYAAAGRSKEEMQIRLMNELMMGNNDFVAGVKEYLAKDAAKNAYKKYKRVDLIHSFYYSFFNAVSFFIHMTGNCSYNRTYTD